MMAFAFVAGFMCQRAGMYASNARKEKQYGITPTQRAIG